MAKPKSRPGPIDTSRMSRFFYSLGKFRPAEAAPITGLSTDLQLAWRKRSILPTNAGHARLDVFDLAEMLFLKSLTDRGVSIHTAKIGSDTAACSIAGWALAHDDAFAGQIESFRPHLGPVLEQFGPLGKVSASFVHRFMVLFADNEREFMDALDPAIFDRQANEYSPKSTGPLVVCDLAAMGGGLRQRALTALRERNNIGGLVTVATAF